MSSASHDGRGSLVAGGLAAILASACCLGPLLLVSLGISGAWIGNLTALEPFRPVFLGLALVAMFLAWWKIFRRAESCPPGEICAVPKIQRIYRVLFWLVSLLVLIALLFPYFLPLFY